MNNTQFIIGTTIASLRAYPRRTAFYTTQDRTFIWTAPPASPETLETAITVDDKSVWGAAPFIFIENLNRIPRRQVRRILFKKK